MFDEAEIQKNNPHPTWVCIGTVEGERRARYFDSDQEARAFMNAMPSEFCPISLYKVELVAERA